MRKLVIVTKKFGGDFTGATLATQYFISKWKDEFDDISCLLYTSDAADEL